MTFDRPATGLMVAGFPLPNINIPKSESCCSATESTRRKVRVEVGKSNVWPRIKKTRGQVLVTPDRACNTHSEATGRSTAMSEPKARFYGTRGELAAMYTRRDVANQTVPAVAEP